jgi:putative transposase
MQLVERHVLNPNHPCWGEIDSAAFASKNLYNLANYQMRQNFFETGKVFSLSQLYSAVKDSDDYKSLPRKVSNSILINLKQNWKAYFKAKKEYKTHREKFTAMPNMPKIPGYKPKMSGRNLLIYDLQAIRKKSLKNGMIKPSGLNLSVKTNQNQKAIDCVRIIPKKTHYVVEVVYTQPEQPEQPVDVNPNWIAGCDIGLNNLAAITSNKPGFDPLLVNGRPLKSLNQYYNKVKATLQSQLDDPEDGTSHRIESLTDRRTRRINHYLHTASRRIIDVIVTERIGTLVIGKNDGWKQSITLGKRNNQNFVSIPHARFVSMLSYKAKLQGIKVIEIEESYTSKCSFLDLEPIEKHESYMGQRIHRGLFRASDGREINADINGAFNIIRKVAPNAFADGVEGVAVRPKWLSAA